MQKSTLLKNKVRYPLILLLFVGLLLIRFFQTNLFYDPFLAFFHTEYQNLTIPEYKTLPLILSFVFRFFLNSIVSITILFLIFKEIKTVKLLLFLYSILFVILIFLFFIFLEVWFIDWQIVFYVRRFLIQPIFLILFLPAFLFQEISTYQKNA